MRCRFNLLDSVKHLWIRDFNVPGEIPAHVYHWHDGFVAFKLVPLVAGDGQLVLSSCQRANVPSDVVAPSNGLHPVNASERKLNVSKYFLRSIV